MPRSDEENDIKVQKNMSGINQVFKERDVQVNAKRLGLPYVNLIRLPLNSDLAKVISEEDLRGAQAALFFKSGKRLRLAISNPESLSLKALSDRLITKGYEVTLSLASQESLESAYRIYAGNPYLKKEVIQNVVEDESLSSFADEIHNLEDLKVKIESSTFDVALNMLQLGAYKSHATDVHFQPEKADVFVRFRVDGVLQPVFHLSRTIYDGIIKEIKQLSHLKLNVTDIPQDGQYGFEINGRRINVRVSILPSHYGETCVMRLLDSKQPFLSFETLGYSGEALRHIKEATQLSHGMILVTGPTGSGKTTTMYSILNAIDHEAKKVITLEDPIEYDLDGIIQSQVGSEYDFSTGLRAILRQDPDVIMVGEIRDLETAEAAAQASFTGHLVISTLHTNSAIESIPRLINMGLKGFILAPALEVIAAQRLVRKLCPDCVQFRPLSQGEKEHIDLTFRAIQAKGIETPAMPDKIKQAVGCEKCGKTGFLGQIAIVEVLRFDQELRNAILEEKSSSEIHAYIDQHCKMLTMHEDGVLKVLAGITTLEEVYRVSF
ncbi:type II secretion system protein GspE [Candidatus Peregrinibacteria bacterium CG_4_10_14_0_2_um_filter_43_11]|nr:MAG: type II secretion system protein GspE [Candidatus Peregrinibacteria bacterium CG_4_10_14_0_2_um_filter_43_11]